VSVGQKVAGQAKRAQQVQAKRSAGKAAGLEEVASLHIHNGFW